MKIFFRNYPIGCIALLFLACAKFEYHSRSGDWAVSSPGLVGGIVVLAIIALVLLFRILNAVQDACIARGILRNRIRNKYEILIPVAIILTAPQARWFGNPMELITGQAQPQWEFTWSDPQWSIPFVAALVGVVLLSRILHLLLAITREANDGVSK